MSQFLITYMKSTGSLVDIVEFSDEERREALAERAKLERQYGATGDVEVVVLGARDRDDLMRSHSRYFKTLHDFATA